MNKWEMIGKTLAVMAICAASVAVAIYCNTAWALWGLIITIPIVGNDWS